MFILRIFQRFQLVKFTEKKCKAGVKNLKIEKNYRFRQAFTRAFLCIHFLYFQ